LTVRGSILKPEGHPDRDDLLNVATAILHVFGVSLEVPRSSINITTISEFVYAFLLTLHL
jgi:hypothetical protein